MTRDRKREQLDRGRMGHLGTKVMEVESGRNWRRKLWQEVAYQGKDQLEENIRLYQMQ